MGIFSNVFNKNKTNNTYQLKKDQNELRDFGILEGYEDPTEAINDYPDFELAYEMAAYPKDDYDQSSCRPEFLHRAIGKVKRESRIHGLLCEYYIWKNEPESSIKSAINYFIMSRNVPMNQAGVHIPCIEYVSIVLKYYGYIGESETIAQLAGNTGLTNEYREEIVKLAQRLTEDRYKSLIQDSVIALRDSNYFTD